MLKLPKYLSVVVKTDVRGQRTEVHCKRNRFQGQGSTMFRFQGQRNRFENATKSMIYGSFGPKKTRLELAKHHIGSSFLLHKKLNDIYRNPNFSGWYLQIPHVKSCWGEVDHLPPRKTRVRPMWLGRRSCSWTCLDPRAGSLYAACIIYAIGYTLW